MIIPAVVKGTSLSKMKVAAEDNSSGKDKCQHLDYLENQREGR